MTILKKAGVPIAIVSALALSACGTSGNVEEPTASGSLADMEPIVLTLNESGSQQSIFGVGWKVFIEEVEERSDGKITFETYYDGSLLSATDALSGISQGVADLGSLSVNYFSQELPVGNWIGALGAPQTENTRAALLGGTVASLNYFRNNEAQIEEFSSHNIHITGGLTGTPQTLACSDEVSTLEQAEGARTRTGGIYWLQEAEAMGMTPVTLALSEIYESLQRGVVDCVMMAPNTVQSYGFGEVAPHTTLLPLTAQQGNVLAFNQETWESLPAEAQQILDAATFTWLEAAVASVMENTADFGEDVDGWGMQFHASPELSEIVQGQQKALVADLIVNAPSNVNDPSQVVADYERVLDEWTTLAAQGFEADPNDPWSGLRDADTADFWSTVRTQFTTE